MAPATSRARCVLLVAGAGGHTAQARILRSKLLERQIKVELIVENETNLLPKVASFSKKFRMYSFLSVLFALGFLPRCLSYLWVRPGISLVVSLGPSNTFPFLIAARLLGRKCCFFESRCRFRTKSVSSKLARLMWVPIVEQNLPVCSKRVFYFGRLE